MSVRMFTGVPGSGKSYRATSEIVDWLKSGKNVISNYPIKMGYFDKFRNVGKFVFMPSDQITVDFLLQFAAENHFPSRKAQTLLVFDEAGIKFNSREFSRSDRQEWINFFANHRHFNFGVILIVQNERMIDRQIRAQVDIEMRHKNIRNHGTIGFFLSLFCGGLYIAIETSKEFKENLSSTFFRINKKRANLYDTMALFDLKGNNIIDLSKSKIPEVLPEDAEPEAATINQASVENVSA